MAEVIERFLSSLPRYDTKSATEKEKNNKILNAFTANQEKNMPIPYKGLMSHTTMLARGTHLSCYAR